MENPKTLDAARAMIAELSAQVGELASLREQASQVEELRSELAEQEEAFNAVTQDHLEKLGTAALDKASLEDQLKAAIAEVSELQAEAKSAEIRALEITGNIGGKPLGVSDTSEDKLTISEVVKAIDAEKDPRVKGELFKKYKQLQKQGK